MSKFFSFYDMERSSYTTINIEKIIAVNTKSTSKYNKETNNIDIIRKATILVDACGKTKKYVIEEDQYNRLMDML